MLTLGRITHLAVPALMGGYEYSPDNINRRADETLADKHNEALKVMPVLFSENGFDVTLFQPPYANYSIVPDLSAFDDCPGVRSFNPIGAYESPEDIQKWIGGNMRNFFMYGLMKASPVLLHPYIYSQGTYNRSDVKPDELFAQNVLDSHRAEGINPTFMKSYNVLTNLPTITTVSEGDGNTFLFMANNTTHEQSLLQEPDYVPALYVDNTQFDAEHADRFQLNGVTLQMANEEKYMHYEVNMAAMLKLGQWFDYLRACGVYDNTRIILVSDHAVEMFVNPERVLPDGRDTVRFNPILLVKDFDAKGFSCSEEFMTNADVPSLAMENLIENPVNPFTGNAINMDAKKGSIYVFHSNKLDVQVNNDGYQFLPGDWYRIDNQDMTDRNNWVKVGQNTVLPED